MIKQLKNINELVMFKHTIFSLPFIFIAMIVAKGGWFGFELLFLGILATVTARNFAMSFNRLVDMDIDIQNPRTKKRPSVDGRISKKSMIVFIFANIVGFVFVTYLINDLAFALSLPVLLIIGGYSYVKRFSYLSHLVLGIGLGMAPIAGAIAVVSYIPMWSLFLGLGVMFWVAGFDILYSLQDIDIDKKLSMSSIPAKFGYKKAMFISKILHIFSLIFWTIFVYMAHGGIFAYIALVFSAIGLAYEHYLIKDNFKKIDQAFFVVNGYLGVVFLIFITMDSLW
ncbi:MAG: 4-hydroxybenzoate polyprenyltransferase [Campylobacteraceae bacterium 4484_166]|nr:MAG: 4-hydroxybenzoate polyprenyltransferase [Campylobacteraceae bacterium 4484_166]